MKQTILILMSLLVYISANSAIKAELDQSAGKIEFLAVGNPGFLKINGKGEAPKGEIQIENNAFSGKVLVDLKSLDTGMGLRNKHMKEKYLKVHEDGKRYAVLTFNKVNLPKGWSIEAPAVKNLTANAQLKVNNTEKLVTVVCSIDANKNLSASFSIKITDFGIDIPSFMSVTVADKVDINVTSKLKL